jgi:dipeptidyl aminopeptidase/acylaminoacyl peptidase
VLTLGLVCASALAPVGVSAKPLSIEEIVSMVGLRSPRLSPDGERVVYVAVATDWERSEYDADLWMVAVEGGQPVRLTRNVGDDSNPRWSPDGRRLAFLSVRDGKAQIYLLGLQGGEPRRLTSSETSPVSFGWSPDGRSVAFTAPDAPPPERADREKRRDDAFVVGSFQPHLHLHQVDIATGESQRITAGDFSVGGFDWTPDGRSLVFERRPTPRAPDRFHSDLYVVSPGDTPRPLVTTEGIDASPQVSPDGRWIAFLSADDTFDWAGEQHLALVPISGGRETFVSSAYGVTPRGFEWSDDGAALWLHGPEKTAARAFSVKVGSLTGGTGDGSVFEVQARSPAEGVIRGADVSSSHDLMAFVREDLGSPPEIYVSKLSSFEPRALTSHNAALVGRDLGDTEVVRWKNKKDGLEIEGLLTLPLGYTQGQRVPLLVFAHGGPASFFDQGFLGYLHYLYPTHVFAAKGYAVLRPNPRGSGAYGEKFKRANRSDWGGMDHLDIQSGIDHLIAAGIADADRLGLMGWSYGGFMASWTITQTDRFRAVSIGAPVTDLFSFQGSADIPGFLPSYFEGLPYRETKRYAAHNPMSHVAKVKTPALIQHGTDDVRVPLFQGKIYYQALLDLGVPAEMVIYPRSAHTPSEPRLRVDVSRRNVWWFEKWIAGASESFEQYWGIDP